jgi:hypothetical protein
MAAMRRVAAPKLEVERNDPHAAAIGQTRLLAKAQTIKRSNGQIALSAYVKTTKQRNSQAVLPATAQTIKRRNSQTALPATEKILKRLNAKTGLLNAGSYLQTGLPANVKTLQKEYSQTLKQG